MARWPTPADLAARLPGRRHPRLGQARLPPAGAAAAGGGGRRSSSGTAAWCPTTSPRWRRCPGVGTYTARAVACFGYGQPQPVVDTNVRRVVARLVHGRAEAGNARAADLADIAALDARRPGAGGPVLGRGDGTRRAGLRRRHAALRRLPGARPLRLAAGRLPGARRAAAPGAEVRRHRPAGARPAARRPAGGARARCPPPRWTRPGTTPSSAAAAWTRCWSTAWSSRPTTACFPLPPELIIGGRRRRRAEVAEGHEPAGDGRDAAPRPAGTFRSQVGSAALPDHDRAEHRPDDQQPAVDRRPHRVIAPGHAVPASPRTTKGPPPPRGGSGPCRSASGLLGLWRPGLPRPTTLGAREGHRRGVGQVDRLGLAAEGELLRARPRPSSTSTTMI